MSKKSYHIVVLPGDGIGPEITDQAVRVLTAAAEKLNIDLSYDYDVIGGAAIDQHGVPMTDDTLAKCNAADAVLLGAVGGPKWDQIPGEIRPEKGLLALRKGMGLYANVRPLKIYKNLLHKSPLRKDLIEKGVDILVIRELSGGIYFGERGFTDEGTSGWDTEKYSQYEVERIGKLAFEAAAMRGKQLHSIDKANVMSSSIVWRNTINNLSKGYDTVSLEHMYVDNCAMQLVLNPSQFDVIVTTNMFGDILSDEMSAIGGSIGLMPSASLGDGKSSLYEPIHGSAPSIAGKNIANPAGTILSCAMMARFAFKEMALAEMIEKAVDAVVESGKLTGDLCDTSEEALSTIEFGDHVLAEIAKESFM